MKPVYIINGFLESGKTEFINYTLAQPYFQVRGKTLLLLCEEGEIEYDEKLLAESRTILELIEEESDFNSAHLIELEKKHKPERIIIEYRAAGHDDRCFYFSDVFYEYEIAPCGNAPEVGTDYL